MLDCYILSIKCINNVSNHIVTVHLIRVPKKLVTPTHLHYKCLSIQILLGKSFKLFPKNETARHKMTDIEVCS